MIGALALVACGEAGPRSRLDVDQGRRPPPLDRGRTSRRTAAQRREVPRPHDAEAVQAQGADHGHGRLSLLPARIPRLQDPAFVTGLNVLPGRPDLVHHVILFRVGPDDVADAKAQDANADGQGWTCFGGAGVSSGASNPLGSAPWLGAWAPGGGERVLAKDIGIPLEAGSRIIMQVHYNLLEGSRPRHEQRPAPPGARHRGPRPAGDHAPARTGRARRAARASPGRCATAPLRCGTCRPASAARPG